MADESAIPPILPDELLYRRVLESSFDPERSPYPEHTAFMPNSNDPDGLSLYRSGDKSPRSVAIGPHAKPDKKYFVAVIRASAIQALGLTLATDSQIKPTDGPPDPSHALIPELNAAVRRQESTIDMARQLSRACVEILGPYSKIQDDALPSV